jgi:hypothetical protein
VRRSSRQRSSHEPFLPGSQPLRQAVILFRHASGMEEGIGANAS